MTTREPYRILVTGMRGKHADDTLPLHHRDIVVSALTVVVAWGARDGRKVVIVHGKCHKGGVDLVAEQWAQDVGVATEPHPADWGKGRGAGNVRNGEMVALGADVCLAFPGPTSTGTWDCLKQAARAGIPGRVYPLI